MSLGRTVFCGDTGDKGQPEIKRGMLSISIREINEQILLINKVITQIEELVFMPMPAECPTKETTDNPFQTVGSELNSLHSRLIGSKNRLEQVLDALNSQLDSNLRLV